MIIDYASYRQSPLEQARIADLIRILPAWRSTVLDIGARDGFISSLLAEHFARVTALDLVRPNLEDGRVTPVQGDVARLGFADNAFDVVCCLEVLEHLSPRLLPVACREIARVARRAVIIGVPYRQDLRIGRTTCFNCGRVNPPWGHQNSFEEATMERLFGSLGRPISTTYVGETTERSHALAAWLMDLGGNPWGTYGQEERCVECQHELVPPGHQGLCRRSCAAAAHRLNQLMGSTAKPRPLWMHYVFEKV
jgi:ubiquinone/menaquinone biosynthesis C-methylase UbiE